MQGLYFSLRADGLPAHLGCKKSTISVSKALRIIICCVCSCFHCKNHEHKGRHVNNLHIHFTLSLQKPSFFAAQQSLAYHGWWCHSNWRRMGQAQQWTFGAPAFASLFCTAGRPAWKIFTENWSGIFCLPCTSRRKLDLYNRDVWKGWCPDRVWQWKERLLYLADPLAEF